MKCIFDNQTFKMKTIVAIKVPKIISNMVIEK